MSLSGRTKKIFLVIIFLASVILLGYLIWRTFFREKTESPTATTTPASIGGLPEIGEGNEVGGEMTGSGNLPAGSTSSVPVVTNEQVDELASGGLTRTETVVKSPVLNPTLSSDGSVQFYNQDDGIFYKITADGSVVALSDKVFHNVESVTWSPSAEKAVIEYPDGSNILYNFQTKKQATLPSYWQEFSFSPDNNQLVSESIGLDVENRWLVVSSDDGSQAKAVEKIGNNADKVYPSWSPSGQMVAMYTEGVDFNRQELYFIGLNDENFKSTVVEGRGLQTQWSPTGSALLYSVYSSSDNMNPRLWVVAASGDTIGQDRTSLNIQTWASKCTFASNTEVYCAVPDYLEEGAGLFPELADKTKDSLYRIDLTTGQKELIAVPDGTYNISSIVVPEDQSAIYFTDKTTEQIYKIKIR